MTAAVLSIRVPVPEDAPHHFHTDTVLLGDRFLLTSWVEGRAANRVGLLDLRDGGWRVYAGLRGMLRDALLVQDGIALLLGDYGLVEIDLATLQTTRSLTAKIGKHNTFLRQDEVGTIAVGNANASMETVVSLATLTAVRRRRRTPEPSDPLPVEAARAGIRRLLGRTPGLVIGATSDHDRAAQCLMVLSSADFSELATLELPHGVRSAHVASDGVIAAPPDIGRSQQLTVAPGLLPRSAGSLPLDDLVAAANASAAAILTKGARRNPPRTVLRDHRIEPGREVSGLQARRVTLDNCVTVRAAEGLERPRISRVQVEDLELQSSSVSGAVLEDVTIDGLRCPHSSGFVFGAEFRRVTIRGCVRGLILDHELHDTDPDVAARYAQWHQERLADPEWMLDLTEATGDITLRGYPSRFIRRNPAIQAVVPAAAVAGDDWRSIDSGGSALRVSVMELARSDWEDVVLIADQHGRRAEADLRYIALLRHHGIALPD
jgi:hypothetical protein